MERAFGITMLNNTAKQDTEILYKLWETFDEDMITVMEQYKEDERSFRNEDFERELNIFMRTNPSTIERQKALAELLKVGVVGTAFIEWTIKESNNISDMYNHLMKYYLKKKFLAKDEINLGLSSFFPNHWS